MSPTTRRTGRPHVAVLSRELILRTALRLLDKRGEQGAGMRDIARALGVQPSALYNHVRGQDDVIAGVRELVSDRIDVSGFSELPWDEAIARWARSYRNAFAAHPPTIALLAVQSLSSAARTSQMYDAVSAGLLRAGWPAARVLPVIVALECFILGAALDHAAPDDMLYPGADTEAASFLAVYEARQHTLAPGERPADRSFALGLDAMLAGLRAQLAALTG